MRALFVAAPLPEEAETVTKPLKLTGGVIEFVATPPTVGTLIWPPRLEVNSTIVPSGTGMPLLLTLAKSASVVPQAISVEAADKIRPFAIVGVDVATGVAVAGTGVVVAGSGVEDGTGVIVGSAALAIPGRCTASPHTPSMS